MNPQDFALATELGEECFNEVTAVLHDRLRQLAAHTVDYLGSALDPAKRQEHHQLMAAGLAEAAEGAYEVIKKYQEVKNNG